MQRATWKSLLSSCCPFSCRIHQSLHTRAQAAAARGAWTSDARLGSATSSGSSANSNTPLRRFSLVCSCPLKCLFYCSGGGRSASERPRGDCERAPTQDTKSSRLERLSSLRFKGDEIQRLSTLD